jgi:hypothetical protein
MCVVLFSPFSRLSGSYSKIRPIPSTSRIILKWIVEKYGGTIWTALICHKIWTSGGFFWTRWWTWGSMKDRDFFMVSWANEYSEEIFCPEEALRTLEAVSSGQSSWLQIERSGFDSLHYQIFWKAVGLERDPFSLVITTEELLERKSSDSSLESPEYFRRDPSRWARGTLYP